MNIDVHNHILPTQVIELVQREPVYGVTINNAHWKSRNISEFPLIPAWHDPVEKLKEMDSKELDGAVLSAAPKPVYYYELPLRPQLAMAQVFNRSAAEFVVGYEDRLRWMAHVPLAFPDLAAEVVAEAAEMGAAGVQLGTSAAGHRLDEPEYDVLWDRLEQLGMPVFLHPAYESTAPENSDYSLGQVIGLLTEVTNTLQRLICGHVLDRHPGLNIVAALGGGYFPYSVGRLRHYTTWRPELADAPQDPWSYVGQIKFDSHVHDPVALRFLIEKAGSANVLIGTDCSFPSCTPAPMAELRLALGDDASAIAAVAETNALEMFWKRT
jgi:aminocarboxymuconate-semialdehyde decarboxylase